MQKIQIKFSIFNLIIVQLRFLASSAINLEHIEQYAAFLQLPSSSYNKNVLPFRSQNIRRFC